ncbi:hypothetical protein I6F53_04795 [Pseudoalteromonas sp. SWN29]|uniref:RipA family octameric membrane protein n=1 Tax=Pseudoalteromonas sp. SWN29 TaxID=2792064 RepID=UPI0018CCD4C5|nr:hypothetical protein [Pseudoalteromonas sp. SWN29]MBH0026300.1 hypothetical protein [Pseudoalteromonas sp. SWN29]
MPQIEKDNKNNSFNTQKKIRYQPQTLIDIPKNSDEKALKQLFKIALDSRNFEITQLVQRNNYFMIFQGVIFMGLIQSTHEIPIVSFMICIVGLVTSCFQARMASGAKFWQEYWEATLTKLERALLSQLRNSNDERCALFALFHDDQEVYNSMVREKIGSSSASFINKMIMNRHSVSRIPIQVAISLGGIWFLLLLCTIASYQGLQIPSFIVGF